jgi:hypothetical protein
MYQTAQEAYFTDFRQYAPDVDGSERIRGTTRQWSTQIQFIAHIDCGGSELCTYRMFTTPIAYIKDQCYEQFFSRDASIHDKKFDYYEYATSSAQGAGPQLPFDTYEWGQRYGIFYVIVSLGPDLAYNFDYSNDAWQYIGSRQYFGPSPAYNPTNGTKSRGDIIMSNRGFEG